jgi:hypothetical protein
MTVSAGMSGTAAMSANAQMVENAWKKAQIHLKTVASTKNGEFTLHPPQYPVNSPKY